MLKWIPYAFIRITAFFIAGIVLAIYQPELISFKAVSVSAGIALIVFILLECFTSVNKWSTLKGIVGLSLVSLLGYMHLLLQTDSRNQDHLIHIKEPITYYEAIIRSAPEAKFKSWKIELEVTSIKTDQWQSAKGKVLAYISKESDVLSWKYGDRILIKGSPSELRPPANPGEFDFKRFLTFKNIYHQHYILTENIKWIASAHFKGPFYYSNEARAWAEKKITTYIHDEQRQAIAMALIIGVTDGIDNEVLNAYAASGAMHVLAVSGMHVGIIYVIILFLLKPLNRHHSGPWIIAIVSLFCLWAFAFVTGLTPSVLRAVAMFTFIVLARPFNRGTNIYNTLAASAFVLLLYNPYLIMSVGFQLSYLAVLGIVYLQNPVYHLWNIENKAGDWIWKITCISFVAQLATCSLGLLYFHQFPVYFLVSNLLIIPISTGVLLVGIVFLLVSFIDPLAVLAGQLTEGAVWLLNWVVFTTERLPYSLITDIHINTFQCWLLMALLLALIFIFRFRSIKWLYVASTIAFLFAFLQWVHFTQTAAQQKWIVYSINGHQAMEWTDQDQSYFYSDSSLLHDDERIRFHTKPYRLINGIRTIQTEKIPFQKEVKNIRLFHWNNQTIANIYEKNVQLPTSLAVDYLVISNNAVSSWQELKKIKADQIIFDGSNSHWWVNKMKQASLADNIAIHSVAEDGAFELSN